MMTASEARPSLRAALVVGACLTVGICTSAFGQGFQGGIRGTARDASGVLPGVSVTLTDEQTGLRRSAVTNEGGEYAFMSVEPGTYLVHASVSGYRAVDHPNVRIGTQSFLVLDLTLEIGAIEQRVTVTDRRR
jgi:hypothetical protein